MESSWAFGLVTVGMSALLLLHVRLTRGNLGSFLKLMWKFLHPEKAQQRAETRLEAALLAKRIELLTKFNQLMIHVTMVVLLVTSWQFALKPDTERALRLGANLMAYGLDVAVHQRSLVITTALEFRILMAIGLFIHMAFTLSMLYIDNPVELFACDKLCGVIFFFIQLILVESRVVVPLYIAEFSMVTWRLWSIMDSEQLNIFIFYCCLASHLFIVCTIVFLDHIMRSMVRANSDSANAASLVAGFRHVLRSLCEGDLVLDSKGIIVDGAESLERLLKSQRKLTETSFLDLFLDCEGRERFLQFFESDCSHAMPRGLRVSLQGANGTVSLDLFQTAIPSSAGDGFRLLALKEDPDQKLPDAPPNSVPSMPLFMEEPRLEPSRKSSSLEILESFEELEEITLLFNSAGPWDVEEAHLRFKRQSRAATIETGMPTLRRFIRPSDWNRIEGMVGFVQQLPADAANQSCFFKKPMLVRLPGESRSYLCSRQTSMSMPQGLLPGDTRFWLHMESFDGSGPVRPAEMELESIAEDSEMMMDENPEVTTSQPLSER